MTFRQLWLTIFALYCRWRDHMLSTNEWRWLKSINNRGKFDFFAEFRRTNKNSLSHSPVSEKNIYFRLCYRETSTGRTGAIAIVTNGRFCLNSALGGSVTVAHMVDDGKNVWESSNGCRMTSYAYFSTLTTSSDVVERSKWTLEKSENRCRQTIVDERWEFSRTRNNLLYVRPFFLSFVAPSANVDRINMFLVSMSLSVRVMWRSCCSQNVMVGWGGVSRS